MSVTKYVSLLRLQDGLMIVFLEFSWAGSFFPVKSCCGNDPVLLRGISLRKVEVYERNFG